MSETEREYAANYRKPPHTRLKKGQSGNPRGRPKKDLPALLVAALNEPVYVTTNGRRRRITKREAIVARMVNEDADRHDEGHRKEDRHRTAAGAAPVRPGRRGGDQRRRGADTVSPAARNPRHERGEPGARDDFFASSQRPGQATRRRLTLRLDQARQARRLARPRVPVQPVCASAFGSLWLATSVPR